ETRQEHSKGAVARKQFLASRKRLRRNPEEIAITFEQRTPAVMPQGVADIVPDRRRAGANQNDPSQIELPLRKREKTGEKKRGLSRHRDARVLTEQRECDRPVAVVGDERSQEIKNAMAH